MKLDRVVSPSSLSALTKLGRSSKADASRQSPISSEQQQLIESYQVARQSAPAMDFQLSNKTSVQEVPKSILDDFGIGAKNFVIFEHVGQYQE